MLLNFSKFVEVFVPRNVLRVFTTSSDKVSRRQGTHGTGKTGKMAKNNSLSGKTQGIWKFCQNTGKTQEIWFAQVVNSLILKVKDISVFAAKISVFF